MQSGSVLNWKKFVEVGGVSVFTKKCCRMSIFGCGLNSSILHPGKLNTYLLEVNMINVKSVVMASTRCSYCLRKLAYATHTFSLLFLLQ